MKIAYDQLVELDACEDQRELFQSLFGEEVEVTRELVMEHAAKFDWDWAGENLLSRKKHAEYERVRTKAWAEYDRVRTKAWAEYDRVRNKARAEYDRVRNKALAEYRMKCAPIFADCAGLI